MQQKTKRENDEEKKVGCSNLVDTDYVPHRVDSVMNTNISPIDGKDLAAAAAEHRDPIGPIDKAPVGFEVADLAGCKILAEHEVQPMVPAEHGVYFAVLVEHEVQPVVPVEHGVQSAALAEHKVQPEVPFGPIGTEESTDTEHQTEAQAGVASTDHEEVVGIENQVDPKGDSN